MSGFPVQIIHRSDNSPIEAMLLAGVKAVDLLIVEREWGPERSVLTQELLLQGVPRHEWPESLHWDWSKTASDLKLLESTGFGVVCNKRWQGVMLTKTSTYVSILGGDKGKPIVYVDYLESAPWNWVIPAIGRQGEFRGLGALLFWTAVQQSKEEGFHGRVSLHSLPQSEQFYEKLGMTRIMRDPNKHNLQYFELSREEAARHLKEGEQS